MLLSRPLLWLIFLPTLVGDILLLIGISFWQLQYQETDNLFWPIFPHPQYTYFVT